MATKQAKTKRGASTKNSLTKGQQEGLETISSVAAIAGLSASVLAAIELSVPVMVLAAIVGAVSALSKLFASHGAEK